MWWLIGGGYALVGVLTALVFEVYWRVTQRNWGPTADDHIMSVVAGIFWPFVAVVFALIGAARALGWIAQQIADRIPAWRRKLEEMKEAIR